MKFTKRIVTLSDLTLSSLNVRQETGDQDALEKLKLSILSAGLINPLIVHAMAGTYEVIAGGRRLSALKGLVAEGKLDKGYKVECRLVPEDADMTKISLMENTVREPMKPLDEFEAFAKLKKVGLSKEEIASDFGITVHHVEQRLRLANIHPEIREAYRDEKITLDVLKAFGTTADQERQFNHFRSTDNFYPYSVKSAMKRETYSSYSGKVKFIGLEAYEKAGGLVERDLFSDDDDDLILSSPDIVEKLVLEKLEGVKTALLAEGWSFVEIDRERAGEYVRSIAPSSVSLSEDDQLRQSEIERCLEELEDMGGPVEEDDEFERLSDEYEKIEARKFVYSQDDKASSGVLLSLRYDGSPDCAYGMVPVEKLDEKSKEDRGRCEGRDPSSEAERTVEEKPLSSALLDDLTAMRVRTFQADLAENHDLAMDLLLHSFVQDVFQHYGGKALLLTVQIRAGHLDEDQIEATPAYGVLDEKYQIFAQLFDGKNGEALLDVIATLSAQQKQELLSFCVARSFSDQLAIKRPYHPNSYYSYDEIVSVAEGRIGTNIRKGWRPTKIAFLNRMTVRKLLSIGGEIMGETWSKSRLSEKKTALVNAVYRLFDPENPTMTQQQRAYAASWLPVEMGTLRNGVSQATLKMGGLPRCK